MKFLTGTQSSFDQLVGGDNIELVSFSRIYCSLTSPEDDQMMFNYPLIKSFNYQTGLQSTEETLRFIGGDRDLVGERSTEDEKNTALDRFFHRNIKDLSSQLPGTVFNIEVDQPGIRAEFNRKAI